MPVMPRTGMVAAAAASLRAALVSRAAAGLQAGDRAGQRAALARQDRFRPGGSEPMSMSALPDQLVDHPGQAEALAVLGREDPHAGLREARDLRGDDDSPAAAVDPDVPGPLLVSSWARYSKYSTWPPW